MHALSPSSPSLSVALPAPPPPRPVSIGARASLRVVQDGAQDCSTCRNVSTCWPATMKVDAIVSNLLVCRMQRGIDREKSTRALLRLIRPKLKKTARWVAARTGGSVENAVMDMESVAVETLLSDYVMGELAPPLVWLFNQKYGGIRHWAVRTVAAAARDQELHLSYGSIGTEPSSANENGVDLEARLTQLNRAATGGFVRMTAPPMFDGSLAEAEALDNERVLAALDIVEDGKTLPVAEYRVLKFCLANAYGNERMTDWLHQHLASVMGISRQNVSRLYGMAYRRVLDAVGMRGSYLRARGIEAPKTRRVNRTKPLTVDEVIAALHILEVSRGRATLLDVAWALGVTDKTVLSLRRRFAGMTPDLIREAMTRV